MDEEEEDLEDDEAGRVKGGQETKEAIRECERRQRMVRREGKVQEKGGQWGCARIEVTVIRTGEMLGRRKRKRAGMRSEG